jgi:hypothetical protein
MSFLSNSFCAFVTLALAFVAMEKYVLAKYVGIDSSEHSVETAVGRSLNSTPGSMCIV